MVTIPQRTAEEKAHRPAGLSLPQLALDRRTVEMQQKTTAPDRILFMTPLPMWDQMPFNWVIVCRWSRQVDNNNLLVQRANTEHYGAVTGFLLPLAER